MEVADDGHVDAHLREPVADRRDRGGGRGLVDGDAHQLRPGARQRLDLLRGAFDVRRVGVGHRLDDDGRGATDGDATDLHGERSCGADGSCHLACAVEQRRSSGWSSASGRRARRARRGSTRRRCARRRRRWRRRTPCPSAPRCPRTISRVRPWARAIGTCACRFGPTRGTGLWWSTWRSRRNTRGRRPGACRARPRRRAARRRSAPAARRAPKPRRHAARPARSDGSKTSSRRRSGRIANYLATDQLAGRGVGHARASATRSSASARLSTPRRRCSRW